MSLYIISSYDTIYGVVYQIPRGKVATYGQIAELANLNAKGEIFDSLWRQGTDYFQRSLLESEGIQFNTQGKINLSEYLWQPTV